MKIGLITDSVGHLSLEGALDLARDHGLSSVEIATGNWSEAPHADLPALVSSADARAEFAEKISSRGLALSALCANGNQLHPTEGRGTTRWCATPSRWPATWGCPRWS